MEYVGLDELALSDAATLRGIIDAVPHPIFVKDDQTRIVVVNAMMCEFARRSFGEMLGKTDYDFVLKEQADVFRGNDLRVLATGETNESEELFTDGDGRIRTIVTRKKRLILPSGIKLLVACITDISDFRRAEALIRHHAEHDALTGLANRRFFYDRVEEQLAQGQRSQTALAVLLIDLDRFKPVNDALGHTAGDAVLCEIASRLKATVRKGDLVARLGGDEFAVVTGATRSDIGAAAGRLAQRILVEVRRPILVGHSAVEVGASIGVAQSHTDGNSAEALLHSADVAMYRGKHDGRGNVRFFEHRMGTAIREQAALEVDLRHAVAHCDIKPFYQPLVSLIDGQLLGFEILARWNHVERGFVPPDLFIPIAERLGLISELTFYMLRVAGRDARLWPADITLSLNISPAQLSDAMLPVRVLGVLNDVGFPAGRLEIEVTESALLSDLDAAKAVLTSFRNLGMRVALDDFGTGYFSLHHLRELQFDKIKIDRSFVQSMSSDAESAKVVNAILGLATNLGLKITAEGIESAEVMVEVAKGGAEIGQGYYFGHAVPAAEAAAFIKFARKPARKRKVS